MPLPKQFSQVMEFMLSIGVETFLLTEQNHSRVVAITSLCPVGKLSKLYTTISVTEKRSPLSSYCKRFGTTEETK